MGTCPCLGSVRFVWIAVCAYCLVLILLVPSTVSAQGTLGYSFEGGLQGWDRNPASAGTTVTHDANSVGATEGNDAMKVTVVAGATFEGVLTGNLDPNDLLAPGGPPTFQVGDPPGFDHVIFDLTLEEPQPFPGTFVSLGITIFGKTQPDPNGVSQFEGLNTQFLDNELITIGDLPAGTHQIVFTLSSATHQLTFEGGLSFNEIFGPPSSDPNDALDIVPTSFQIYINKPGTDAWEGIFDNIRFADAIPGDFAGVPARNTVGGDLVVDGKDFLFWQRGETLEGGSQDELAIWEANYGSVVPLAAAIATVPEPATVGLACAAMLALLSVRRKTS